MKTAFISGLLLLILTAYLVIPVMPVFHYLLNRDYIAKNLCINKNKPKCCCHGKCHLVKQLQKANSNRDKDPKNTGSWNQFKDLNEFVLNPPSKLFIFTAHFKYQVQPLLYPDQMACFAIFVPPKS